MEMEKEYIKRHFMFLIKCKTVLIRLQTVKITEINVSTTIYQ